MAEQLGWMTCLATTRDEEKAVVYFFSKCHQYSMRYIQDKTLFQVGYDFLLRNFEVKSYRDSDFDDYDDETMRLDPKAFKAFLGANEQPPQGEDGGAGEGSDEEGSAKASMKKGGAKSRVDNNSTLQPLNADRMFKNFLKLYNWEYTEKKPSRKGAWTERAIGPVAITTLRLNFKLIRAYYTTFVERQGLLDPSNGKNGWSTTINKLDEYRKAKLKEEGKEAPESERRTRRPTGVCEAYKAEMALRNKRVLAFQKEMVETRSAKRKLVNEIENNNKRKRLLQIEFDKCDDKIQECLKQLEDNFDG
jgi:hypothetical protein